MSTGRSRDDLLKFHDYLSSKGLIPQATARARKAASKQVLAILDEEEASDVLALDLDFVMQRFSTLHGQEYNPNSLRDYASRLRAAVEDFRSYTGNPLGFRPAGRTRAARSENNEKVAARKSEATRQPEQISTAQPPSPPQSANILPIRLRQDLTIQIAGLPFDLTPGEAKKIANIILAHAAPE
jgi:hypothetical protein